MSIPRSLVEAVREHRVVPFVGAGVSVGVKPGLFPAWKRLLQNIADYMEADGLDARDIERVRGLVQAGELVLAAETALRALGPYVFHRFLRTHYRQPRPGDAKLDVVRAIWALRPPLVITTNYDNVLRWGGPAEVQLVANDQHEELVLLGDATSDWPWIWHLHGTIERMATVILAGRDYKRLYEKDERNRVASYERALFELQKTLASKSLLYIGFGLTDPYVLEQIAHVLELTRGSVAPSYALMRQGEGNRADLWENYNVRLIEYAEHHMLADVIADIARQAFPAPAAEALPVLAPEPAQRTPAPAAERPAGMMDGAEMGSRSVSGNEAAASPAPPMAFVRDLSFDPGLFPGGKAMGGEGVSKPAPAVQPAPSPPAKPTSAPAVAAQKPIIERGRLVAAFGSALLRERRLLLLAPHGGGARRLARQIATAHFGQRVTWLEPPKVPDCTEAQYCSFLAGRDEVADFAALARWLEAGCASEHLVVLRHDGGPLHHLVRLGELLRAFVDAGPRGGRVHVLVAGEAAAARLRREPPGTPLFSDAPVEHVPAFDQGEVVQVLAQAGLDGARWGRDVWQATGGLPALVVEAIAGREALDASAVTERLARSTAVRGRLARRLLDDDRAQLPVERHARTALAALLAGRDVRPLAPIMDDLDHAEVRLFYDGLVIAGPQGATVLRCEAVRRAAAALMSADARTA
jgi:hypothetical protein